MSTITHVHARQILDSRGNPTVEVDVRLESGAFGRAAVPSGASTGEHEAVELRDGGERIRRQGRPARRRARQRRDRRARFVGTTPPTRQGLDRCADRARRDRRTRAASAPTRSSACRWRSRGPRPRTSGEPLWRYLGGEAAVDAADADDERPQRRRARRQPGRLPGVHDRAGRARTRSPRRCAWAPRPTTTLKSTLQRRGLATGVGDEGGFAPALESNEAPLELLVGGDRGRGLSAGRGDRDRARPRQQRVLLRRRLPARGRGPRRSSSSEMVDYWEELVDRYPIVSLEDGMAEDDWDGWRMLTERLGGQLQLVGDDIFVTNPAILRRGIEAGIANSILIKLNQIGTLTETLETIALARDSGLPVASSRIAPARPRTRRSPTSPSPPASARSRPARRRAPSAWPSTTSCCASRRSSASGRASPAATPSQADVRTIDWKARTPAVVGETSLTAHSLSGRPVHDRVHAAAGGAYTISPCMLGCVAGSGDAAARRSYIFQYILFMLIFPICTITRTPFELSVYGADVSGREVRSSVGWRESKTV